jgi:hypothetical protein
MDSSDYCPWKMTKKIKQDNNSSPPLRTPQGTWSRKGFQSHPSENEPEEEGALTHLLESIEIHLNSV